MNVVCPRSINALPIAQQPWAHEQRLLANSVKLVFSIAGILWIPLGFVELDPDVRTMFLQRQYQLYVFLLVLWGYDWRRQLRRAECIIHMASQRQCSPENVQWNDIQNEGLSHHFDVLVPRVGMRSLVPLLLTWGTGIAAIVWLMRQVWSIAIALIQ